MANQCCNVRRVGVVLLICTMVLAGGCHETEHGVKSTIAKGTNHAADAYGIHTYSTTFPGTENPIDENGNWVGGSSAGASIWAGGHIWTGGRLWGDVQTALGIAFGVDEPTRFGDPTVILTGAWGPTQTVTATVRIRKTPVAHCYHEVELRLRTTISDHSITGFEAYCSVMPDKPYCHIARWNGPNGSYWNFETGSSEAFVVDGDVMKATASGTNLTVITLYKNGVQILQEIDSGAAGGGFGAFGPWPRGNPGIGFYDDHDSNWEDFGFSSFNATDAAPNSTVPAPLPGA